MSSVIEAVPHESPYQRSTCSMFHLPIDRLTVTGVIERVEEFIRSRKPHQIAYLNAHCINRAFEDKEYMKIIQQSDLVYPDGMGVVWASHLTHSPLPERVNIGDFLFDLCRLAEKKKYRIYFLGSSPGVAERAVQAVLEQCPAMEIAGYNHGYFTPGEEKAIIADIAKSRADILLVGFGVPDQEKWIHKNLDKLKVPVAWGVGALFEYYSGKVSRAPFWMRSHGLEWLYRLVLEPSRLWKRYLIGNVLFIMRVITLVILDILTAAASWFAAYWIRYQLPGLFGKHPINDIITYLYAFPVIIALWIFCSAWYGLYRRNKTFSEFGELLAISKAAVLALLISMAVAFLLKSWDLGRSIIFMSGGLNFILLIITRQLSHLFGGDKKN